MEVMTYFGGVVPTHLFYALLTHSARPCLRIALVKKQVKQASKKTSPCSVVVCPKVLVAVILSMLWVSFGTYRMMP